MLNYKQILIVDTLNEIPSHYQYFLLSKQKMSDGNDVIFVTDNNKNISDYSGTIVHWKNKKFFNSLVFFIRILFKYKRFDAVILNFSSSKYSFLFYCFSKKVIITVQSDFFSTSKLVNFKRSLKFLFCTNVLTVSKYMKNKIVETYYFVSEQKCCYLYNSISFTKYERQINLSKNKTAFINNQSKKIIFIGALEVHKGFNDLIEFSINTNESQFDLTIAGDGSLKRLIPLNNNKIKYLGKINHFEVFEQLQEHHFLILPSKNEAFGQVIIEAFVMGVIPIVRRNTGASELIEHGVNGFLFEDINEVTFFINQKTNDELEKIRETIRKQSTIFDSSNWVEEFNNTLLEPKKLKSIS